MEKEVSDWWEQTRADLKTARDLIVSRNYYASVSYAQQAAEKALKTLYFLLYQKTPPKIHDLIELSRLVKASSEICSSAEKLSATYFSSRYPGAAPEIPVRYYTEEKAQLHLHEAEVILQWVGKKIK